MAYRAAVVVFLLMLPAAGLAASYKVEPAGACTLPELSDPVRAALRSHGLRVSDESGPLFELWLRKVVPQKAGSSAVAYDTIATGTFVGVIRYHAKGGSYRGQAIKPGTYGMRYQTILSDGNHLGVSPSPDFVLLTPPSSDTNPDAVIPFDELVRLGKQASGINHPHPLLLAVPVHQGKTSFNDDEGKWFLESTTRAAPPDGAEVDFPFAVVLIGKAEG